MASYVQPVSGDAVLSVLPFGQHCASLLGPGTATDGFEMVLPHSDSDYYSSYARRSEVAYHANGMGQSATDGGEVRTVADSVYVFPIL